MIQTSPYHPQGNGQVERSHGTINNLNRATAAQRGEQKWPRVISAVQLTVNSATHEDYHLSSYQIIMGNLAKLPADLNLPRKLLREMPLPPSYLEELQMCFHKSHDLLRSPSENPAEWTAQPMFQPGDAILVAVSPVHCQHKFAPKWEGPFRVIRSLNQHQVVFDYGGQERIAHVNNVKCYTGKRVSCSPAAAGERDDPSGPPKALNTREEVKPPLEARSGGKVPCVAGPMGSSGPSSHASNTWEEETREVEEDSDDVEVYE